MPGVGKVTVVEAGAGVLAGAVAVAAPDAPGCGLAGAGVVVWAKAGAVTPKAMAIMGMAVTGRINSSSVKNPDRVA